MRPGANKFVWGIHVGSREEGIVVDVYRVNVFFVVAVLMRIFCRIIAQASGNMLTHSAPPMSPVVMLQRVHIHIPTPGHSARIIMYVVDVHLSVAQNNPASPLWKCWP
jgi:hypothetical protein